MDADELTALVAGAVVGALALIKPQIEAAFEAGRPGRGIEDDPLFGIDELARSVNRSGPWLRNLIASGEGPATLQVGRRTRIRRSAWEAWLAECERRAPRSLPVGRRVQA